MRKVELDQYFTRHEDAKRCIAALNDLYPLTDYDIILEPSAGAGAFFQLLPPNREGLDILPLCDGVKEGDFFEYQPPPGGKIAVIGNPPFGRRGSLAKRFFQKSAEFADVIAFIVPAIFGKPAFYKSLDLSFHLEWEEPIHLFELPNGQQHKVNCLFQIWKKKDIHRIHKTLPRSHQDFEMIHRHISRTAPEEIERLVKDYHFAFGQVSHKLTDLQNIQRGSQFIIKDVSSHGKVREIFQSMNFDHLKRYSMGAVSLSRSDIIEAYSKVLANVKK